MVAPENIVPVGASPRIGSSTDEAWIPLSRLLVPKDGEFGYQRHFDERWAKRIAANFDDSMWTKPLVAARVGGMQYAVIDGQHRIGALRILHKGDDPLVLCDVIAAGDVKSEAKRFLGVNHFVKMPNAKDTFKALLISEDEHAMRVNRLLHAYGFQPKTEAGKQRDGELSVAAINLLMRQCSGQRWELLEDTLRLIRDTYGDNTAAVGNIVFTGIGSFLATYSDYPQFDRRRLIELLAKTHPNSLTRSAQDNRQALGTSGYIGSRRAILAIYNNRLQSKRRLPEV